MKKLIAVIAVLMLLVMTGAALADSMVVVNCNSWVSLRETASTSAAQLAKIPYGAEVERIENKGNFAFVTYNGMRGFVLRDYLLPTNVWAGDPYMTVMYCNEWISLRTAPSSSADRIGTIRRGGKVRYLGQSGVFYKVECDGYIGWVDSAYVGCDDNYSDYTYDDYDDEIHE